MDLLSVVRDRSTVGVTRCHGANIDSLKHVMPEAFLVFSGFDMASRGNQTYVTITEKTKV